MTGESKFDIDIEKSELRPRSTERNVGLVFETVTTQSNPTTTDYNFVNDFTDGNITRGGAALTLKYTEAEFISQQSATRVENLNPFLVDVFVGAIELVPSSDFWIEEIPLAPQTVEIDNAFDAIAELLGVEDRENGGMASSFWNSSETTWNGRDTATLTGEEIIDRQVVGSRTSTDIEEVEEQPQPLQQPLEILEIQYNKLLKRQVQREHLILNYHLVKKLLIWELKL